jgi:hypothetical protein
MKREYINLMEIGNHYPKFVVTLDEYTGASFEGIKHVPLKVFLNEFQ